MSEMDGHENRLLLISNSTLYGGGYLDHAEREIRDFLGKVRRVMFIPFALHDRDAYAASARRRLAAMDYEMDSAHEASDPEQAVNAAEAVFIGGGNTFRLLKGLYDFELLPPIRRYEATRNITAQAGRRDRAAGSR
jgi:dipeptidase E